MSNLLDQVNKAINRGTDATTLGAGLIDKYTKMGSKFGLIAPEEPQKPTPARDTGIQPIGNFIAQIKNTGLAKHNHYTFTLIPPSKTDVFNDGSQIDPRVLQLLCSNCVLPGVNIGSSQHRTFGEQYDMPNDKTYGSVTSSFYVDNHFHVKKLFDQWSEAIMDPVSRTFNFYDDYVTNIEITVFDKNSVPHYTMIIEDAWPKSVNDITLGYDSQDFMKLDVTWAYRKWSSYLIENSVHNLSGPVNTVQKPSIHDRLMGYVGNFKDYQDRFNNISGDMNRAKDMLKNKDWGGFVGQSFGGAGSLF